MTQANNVAIESSQINSSGVLTVPGGGTGLSTVGTSGYFLQSNGTGLQYTSVTSSQWTTSGSDIYYNTGNVGIGTIPISSQWTGAKVLQLGSTAWISGRTSNASGITDIANNSYLNATPSWVYTTTNGCSIYEQSNDTHIWFNAPTGTAGTTFTPTERMRITSGGNVGIGTTSPSALLTVGGNPPGNGVINAVSSSGNIAIAVSDNVNASLYIRPAAGGVILGTDAGGVIRFASGGNAVGNVVVSLDASGNLLNSSSRPMVKQTGGVLQVVQGALNTYTTTTSTSFTDTGLTVTITPNSSSSRFFIQVFIGGSIQVSNGTVLYNLVRNGTAISQPASGASPASFIQWPNTSNASWPVSFGYVDSPATASAITYKVQWRVDGGTGYLNRHPSNTDYNSTSNLIVQEIAG